MQWLSSVYSNQWLGIWDGTLPDTVVILRDQSEGCLLCRMNCIVSRSNNPEQSPYCSAGDVDQLSGSAVRISQWLLKPRQLGWLERKVRLQSVVGGLKGVDWENPDTSSSHPACGKLQSTSHYIWSFHALITCSYTAKVVYPDPSKQNEVCSRVWPAPGCFYSKAWGQGDGL